MGHVSDWCLRLQDPELDVRLNAAESLSLLGPEAAFAAVDLVGSCADEESVREYAVAALEGMGPPPDESIEGLISLLRHRHPLVLYWAVTLLGRTLDRGVEVQKAVAMVARDTSDRSVQQRAVWALGQMHPLLVETRNLLQTFQSSNDPRLARLATQAIEPS
jgi:HEAT repeat protein